MRIQRSYVGVHHYGYDVWDNFKWVAWFKTLEASRKAYPNASIDDRYR